MPRPENALEEQIEAAYDYRGHVTITFTDGKKLEGYIFNREFANPKLKEDHFIEYFPRGSDERKRCLISSIAAVELTGKDCAETYEQGVKRTQGQKL